MSASHKERESEDFIAPEGIIFRQIDQKTGLLSTDKCRNPIREAYLPGTEPRQYCSETTAGPEQPEPDDEIAEKP